MFSEVTDPKRRLAYAFFCLPSHVKIGIANRLGINDDSMKSLSGIIELTQAFFSKAMTLDILDKLWDEAVVEYENTENIINPFKK